MADIVPAPKASLGKNAAQMKGRTRHAALANVVEAGWLPDGAFFQVLELGPEAVRLGELVGRIDEKQLLPLAAGLLQGLEYLHRTEIVHGALGLHAIYLDGGRVKIGEFFWAHDASERPLSAEVGATVRRLPEAAIPYAAPEVLSGKAPRRESDIYSVGAVLYHLLAGAPPRGPGPGRARLEPLSTARPGTSEDTCAIIHRMLHPSAAERPPVFVLSAMFTALVQGRG